MNALKFIIAFITFLATSAIFSPIFGLIYMGFSHDMFELIYVVGGSVLIAVGFYLSLKVYGIKKLERRKFLLLALFLSIFIFSFSYFMNRILTGSILSIMTILTADLILFYSTLKMYKVDKDPPRLDKSIISRITIAIVIGVIASYVISLPQIANILLTVVSPLIGNFSGAIVINGIGVLIGGFIAALIFSGPPAKSSLIGGVVGLFHADLLSFIISLGLSDTTQTVLGLGIIVLVIASVLEGGIGGLLGYYVLGLGIGGGRGKSH